MTMITLHPPTGVSLPAAPWEGRRVVHVQRKEKRAPIKPRHERVFDALSEDWQSATMIMRKATIGHTTSSHELIESLVAEGLAESDAYQKAYVTIRRYRLAAKGIAKKRGRV